MCRRWAAERLIVMITVQNLTRRYGRFTAVDDISFHCEPGTVTGFLGPNGAGKSTALRAITGLTPPTSGAATIDGRRYADLPNPGQVVGVMLDAAAQHPSRTGLETLRLSATVIGVPRSRAGEMLERVGLAAAATRRVGNYSLGMRQRLGIASTLMGDPEVLILDEPANGMDPEGIRWMRGLLQNFAAGGGTVLLSDLLQTGGTFVRGLSPAGLRDALVAAGLTVEPADDGRCRVDGIRSRSAGRRPPPARCCWNCAPPTPAWRTCSSSSPDPSTGEQHDRRQRHRALRDRSSASDP